MWLHAAEQMADSGGNATLITAIFGLVGTIVVTAGSVAAALFNSRSSRTTPSPPPPDPGANAADLRGLQQAMEGMVDDIVFLRERTAVHGQQIVDLAETSKVVDVRLDRIEAAKDRDHPSWRSYGGTT